MPAPLTRADAPRCEHGRFVCECCRRTSCIGCNPRVRMKKLLHGSEEWPADAEVPNLDPDAEFIYFWARRHTPAWVRGDKHGRSLCGPCRYDLDTVANR